VLDRFASPVTVALAARFSRRWLIRLAAGAIVPAVVACGGGGGDDEDAPVGMSPTSAEHPAASPDATAVAAGKLVARPGSELPAGETSAGLQSLGLERAEDAILYVPATYTREEPAPLAVLFHGAGGDARGAINLLLSEADAAGMLLLATSSREATWDIISSGGFGVDIELLDRALRLVFAGYAVDPARIAVAGFSDGASYALSVGLTNGDLFSAIVAFSPGFVAPGEPEGRPRIFISHGTQDIVLPIDQTSRLFAPQLVADGYAVEYVEFDGLHLVPDDIVADALEWWLNDG